MRHVRMLGICLAAVFVMSATTLVVASPALAGGCNHACKEQKKKEKEEAKKHKEETKVEEKKQKEKEKQEAKEAKSHEKEQKEREKLEAKGEYSPETWGQYKHCPYTNKQVENCFFAQTFAGSKGGFFSLGNVTVDLNKPITLQGGFTECEAVHPIAADCEETGLYLIAPVNGGETLESPELQVKGGMGLITSRDQELAHWPQALKESFSEAKKNKETSLNVKIEIAGNSIYENPNTLSTENLLLERGNAFELPLKVRMINPWLEHLGGGPCQVGNDEHPIMQDLTSEAPGRSGLLLHNTNFSQVELVGGKLVDLSWPVPEEADASGCGGPYESYVDAAINEVLELPHQHGTTILEGRLFSASDHVVQHEYEFGQETLPRPTVTDVEPREGPSTGGTSVVITGTNFYGAKPEVSFGSGIATDVNVESPTRITLTTPEANQLTQAEVVNVTVETEPNDTSVTSPADRFTYNPEL